MSPTQDEIQIADVALELAKLGAEGKKKGQVKGCLFNLIVYSQDPHRGVFLKDIVQTVTETFPCRIIFIECDLQTTQNFLKVSVEEELIKKDGSIISCDRINIKSTPKYLNRVPYLVLPHFVPDLPIYLLWGQDPSQENEILPFLLTYATRLIFDSDSSCDIRTFCRKMFSEAALRKIPVTDMNWASLASWRQILFQIFDTNEKLEQLRNCKQITIRYNSKVTEIYQHTERRAVYLQGWLAAQLGWQYTNSSIQKGSMKITYKNRQGGQTDVILAGENKVDLTPGAIFDVEVRVNDDIIYDLARISAQPFIRAQISMKEACELPVTLILQHSKKGLMFMNEIFFFPCSQHYWNMLKAIENLQVPC